MDNEEIELYRSLVLSNMEAAGMETKGVGYDYSRREDVRKAARNIGRYTGRIGGRAAAYKEKLAFWVGQLTVLDMIKNMRETFTAEAAKHEAD